MLTAEECREISYKKEREAKQEREMNGRRACGEIGFQKLNASWG